MLLATLKILVILITPEIHLALHWTIAQSQKKIFRIINQMREKGYIYGVRIEGGSHIFKFRSKKELFNAYYQINI